MSYSSLLIHSVDVYTHIDGAADRYGNPTDDWSAPVTYSARVEQMGTDETLINRDTRHINYTLFLEGSAVIGSLDKVVWEALTLRVVGTPEMLSDGIGDHHIEAELEVFEG